MKILIVDRRQSTSRPWKLLYYFACSAAFFFGPGVLVGSQAMQWAGFFVLLFLLSASFVLIIFGLTHENLTIPEARLLLDRLEEKERRHD